MTIPIGIGATGEAVAENRVITAVDDPKTMFPRLGDQRPVLRRDRLPLDDHRPGQRRVRAARSARGLLDPAERLRRRRRRGHPLARRPGRDRDHERPADRGAEPVAPRGRAAGGRRSARCARSRPGSPRSARPTSSSSTSPTRRPGCSIPRARSSTSSTRSAARSRSATSPGIDPERTGRWAAAGSARTSSGGPSPGGRRSSRSTTSTTSGSASTPTPPRSPAGSASVRSRSRRSSRSAARSARSRSSRPSPGAFGEDEANLLGALADQAAIAMLNARLIDELERSQTRARGTGRDRTLAPRHLGPDHLARRSRRDPRPRRRGVAPPAPLRRRPPDPDVRGRDLPGAGDRGRRHGRRHRERG